VEHGAISIYGATLRKSLKRYRIYAPATHALPQITALSDSAIIYLLSISIDVEYPPDIGIRGIWDFPRGADTTALSFGVVFFLFLIFNLS